MRNSLQLSGRVRSLFALQFTLVASFGHAQTSSRDDGLPELELEPITVTGSRIQRIDTETPQPVLRWTARDMEATGYSTVGDALRAQPLTTGRSLLAIDSGQTFAPGLSAVNLRGLGNNNTLMLVNGRRAAPFATAGFDGFQTIFDFNSLPTAALDSVEILKDGGSAIYGADAVAGVVNVRFKSDFEGLRTSIHMGNTVDTDSFERGASVVFGTKSGRFSFLAALDWREREAIFGRDLDYTDSADGREFGGYDQTSSRTPIARVYGLVDRERFPDGRATFATPQTSPTLDAAVPHRAIGYNFQRESGLFPEERMSGLFTRATYELTDEVAAFAEVSFRRSEVDSASASTPLAISAEQGDSPWGGIVFPSSNPFNPFGQDIYDLRWRMQELGNRELRSESDTSRVVVGLEGELPGSDWTWDAGLLYAENVTDVVQGNYAVDRRVQDAFNGILIDGETLYANPFGPNDPRVVDYMRVDNPMHDEFLIRSADLSVAGPLVELPGGMARMVVGGESRSEEMDNQRSPLNESLGLVGGGDGTSTQGSREVHSAFMEVNLPLHDMLEVQLAGRFESYSDFGESTKPKVAAMFRPVPEVVVRGSFGQSYLAPNLAFLYSSQNTSFTSNTLADPLRPDDPRQQIKQLSGGNPDLQPEETDVTYVGLVLQPFARRPDSLFHELSVSADYVHFDQTNLLGRPTPTQILGNLDLYGDLVIRNAPAAGESVGTINAVTTTWQNLSRATYTAYDFNISWTLPESTVGRWRFDTSWTHLQDYAFNGFDQDGLSGFPLNSGNFTVSWQRGDWGAAAFVNYVGSYLDAFRVTEVEDQYVINPQVTYSGFERTTITLGLRNALDDAPPVDISDVKLVNPGTNHVEPLFWYLRVSREW